MANLNKMEKCELIEYCKKLQEENKSNLKHKLIYKNSFNDVQRAFELEEKEKNKWINCYEELEKENEKLKIENEKLDHPYKYLIEENEKLIKINQDLGEKMLNFGDIKIDDEKMVSMVKGIPQLIDTIQKLEKENEEITNKYNEAYDLIEKTKTNMEEMLDKIEKQKQEIEEMTNKYERLLKHKREIDAENTKTTDLFNRASHENQILKKVDKNKAVNKVLEVNKHLIEYSKNQSEEIEKLRDENKLLEKDNDLLEEENKKIKNELDDYKVFKSRFNDFVKNYHK